jgi:hypothetical protein
VGLGLRLGHHLNEKRPAWEVAALDRVEQVAGVALAVRGDEGSRLGVGAVRDPLLRAEVKLTQTRSFAAFIIEKVWLPKPCIWRKLFGMPRSDMTTVT